MSEKVYAIDAGKKEIPISISADGTTVVVQTAYEILSIPQKELERIISRANADISAKKIEARLLEKASKGKNAA